MSGLNMGRRHFPFGRHAQQGMTLIELMVGMTIGLMTITVAIGTLMISRQVAGATSEASQLQQQAAQAFRTIAQQARQAGSLRLNLAFAKDGSQGIDIADPVAFETQPNLVSVKDRRDPDNTQELLTLTYQNYQENLVGSVVAKSQFSDCLGGQGDGTGVISNSFSLDRAKGELKCRGNGSSAQALIQNVADFRVRFIEQTGSFGNPTMRYRTADTLTDADWPHIHAIEVCLEMEGMENLPESSAPYLNCANQSVARGQKLRMVFRNTYQIRSQGRPTAATP